MFVTVNLDLTHDELPAFVEFTTTLTEARKAKYDAHFVSMADAEASAVAVETAAAPTPEPVKEIAYREPTIDETVAALKQYLATKDSAEAVKLLGEFGAGRVTELKPEDRAAFIARLDG